MSLRFEVTHRDPRSAARRGVLHTPHGAVETPAFMPVGTYGAVKGLRSPDLEELGADIVLTNAYHLAERPGDEVVAKLGGLHAMMGWERAILTDSGGYQVFSLSERCEVDDDGVTFRSTLDGSLQRLTPGRVVEIQARLGSDVAMVLDVCVRAPVERSEAERAMRLTQDWAERSLRCRDGLAGGLFGIVQGAQYEDLRGRHARQLAPLEFDGFAIGGLSVGEDKATTWRALEAAVEELPEDRPRYLMGMGLPEDILEAVSRGVDLFDCVIPTRHARNGMAFTSAGPVSIKRAEYAEDTRPLDPDCACPTCRRHPRGYLRYLQARGEVMAGVLLTWHNVHHYLDTMGRIRHAIAQGRYAQLRDTGLQVPDPRSPC